MEIVSLPSGPLQTNAYLLLFPTRNEAILVDAPSGVQTEANAVLAEKECRLVAVLLTHGHWDHIGDLAALQNDGIPVYAHEADRRLIEDPASMMSFAIPGMEIESARIDHVVDDGDTLDLGGETIEIRHVPGHSPGNVLFYFTAHSCAFVGDALFAGGIGRYDLPGGSFEELSRSIRSRIYTLPDDTVIYPGHGPSTRVAVEKFGNPFVQMDS